MKRGPELNRRRAIGALIFGTLAAIKAAPLSAMPTKRVLKFEEDAGGFILNIEIDSTRFYAAFEKLVAELHRLRDEGKIVTPTQLTKLLTALPPIILRMDGVEFAAIQAGEILEGRIR